MKINSPFTATLIITAATALVIAYTRIFPDMAIAVIVTYISTIIFLTLILSISAWLYKKHKSSVDAGDIASISENLNTEMIIWTDDFSAVYMNRHMRELLGIQETNFDHKAEIMRAFGINSLESENINKIIDNNSYEARFTNANHSVTTIAWSTSLIKRKKNLSLYLSTGFNLTEIKKMRLNLANTNDLFNYSMKLAEIGIIISNDMVNYIASSETVRMLGLKGSNISIKSLRSLIHPNDRLQFDSAIKSAGTDDSNEVKSIELRIKSADGFYHWYSYRYKPMNHSGSKLPMFSGALIDSTKEHEKDLIIERLAYIDEVTEIANRNKLMDIGQETYEQCRLLN